MGLGILWSARNGPVEREAARGLWGCPIGDSGFACSLPDLLELDLPILVAVEVVFGLGMGLEPWTVFALFMG